jgi:Zn finger protein HypA/HybF involved in hydrogenase expression
MIDSDVRDLARHKVVRMKMEERDSCSQQSSEFACPHCESVAFEIIRTQRVQDDIGVDREFLVMRCLNCSQFFTHELMTPEAYATTGGQV